MSKISKIKSVLGIGLIGCVLLVQGCDSVVDNSEPVTNSNNDSSIDNSIKDSNNDNSVDNSVKDLGNSENIQDDNKTTIKDKEVIVASDIIANIVITETNTTVVSTEGNESNETNTTEEVIIITKAFLNCKQDIKGVLIEEGSYTVQKLKSGSVQEVKELIEVSENNTSVEYNFELAEEDKEKNLSCGSEFKLQDGSTKTYRSNTVTL